jgi:hypothetical protein
MSNGVVSLDEKSKKKVVDFLTKVATKKWVMKDKADIPRLCTMEPEKNRFIVLKEAVEDSDQLDNPDGYSFFDLPYSKLVILFDTALDVIVFARMLKHVAGKTDRANAPPNKYQSMSPSEALAYGIKYAFENLDHVCPQGTSIGDAALAVISYNNSIVNVWRTSSDKEQVFIIPPVIDSMEACNGINLRSDWFKPEFLKAHRIPGDKPNKKQRVSEASSSSKKTSNGAISAKDDESKSSKSKSKSKTSSEAASKPKSKPKTTSHLTEDGDHDTFFKSVIDTEEIMTIAGFPTENGAATFVSKPYYDQLMESLMSKYPEKPVIKTEGLTEEMRAGYAASQTRMNADTSPYAELWKFVAEKPGNMSIDDWVWYLIQKSHTTPAIGAFVEKMETIIQTSSVLSDTNRLLKGTLSQHQFASLTTQHSDEKWLRFFMGYIILGFRLNKKSEKHIATDKEVEREILRLREEEKAQWMEDKEVIKELKAQALSDKKFIELQTQEIDALKAKLKEALERKVEDEAEESEEAGEESDVEEVEDEEEEQESNDDEDSDKENKDEEDEDDVDDKPKRLFRTPEEEPEPEKPKAVPFTL